MTQTITSLRNYAALQAELDKILAWFESEEVDIDTGVEQYERALKLIAEMEAYLKTAENKVTKIKKQFGVSDL